MERETLISVTKKAIEKKNLSEKVSLNWEKIVEMGGAAGLHSWLTSFPVGPTFTTTLNNNLQRS
jgi:hypothetical protein